MTWIIIIGLFLLAFVPLLYAIPSPKERRQAKLRKRAMSDGIKVEVMFIPKLSADASEMVNAAGKLLEPKIECAAYQLVLSKRLDIPRLLFLKTFVENKQSLYDAFEHWGVRSETEFRYIKDHPELIELIESSVEHLPEDALALELAPQKISVLWRESDDSGSSYQSVLETLKMLKEHFERPENICDL